MSGDSVHEESTLGEFFLRCCQRHGDATAVVAGEQSLSYRQLLNRSMQISNALSSSGLGTGDGLAVMSGNRLDVITVFGACYLLGLRITPVSPFASEGDQIFMLGDAGVRALVIDPTLFSERGQRFGRDIPSLEKVFSLGPDDHAIDILASSPSDNPDVPVQYSSTEIAFLSYTGGTTGKPKGVVLSHRNILSAVRIWCAEWEWPRSPKMAVATPVSHAGGALSLPVMQLGGEFHVLPGFEATDFLAYMQSRRISCTFLVPTMLFRLLEEPVFDQQQLPDLETVFYGAAPASPKRLVQAVERMGPIFMQLYGQSEVPMGISLLAKHHHVGNQEWLDTVGVPLTGAWVAILDDANNPCKPGDVGEICVRGVHVMQGYWGNPDQGREVFSGDWLHTGDMGVLSPEGFLSIVGRKKEMIISGGFNVYPKQVEDALCEWEGVVAAAVYGAPDEEWGELVAAALVVSDQDNFREEELLEFVRERVGSVSVPRSLRLLNALPLTSLGKVDKKQLAQASD